MAKKEKEEKKTTALSRKENVPAKPTRKPSPMIEPYRPLNTLQNFDRMFERFRSDFEGLLFPSPWINPPSLLAETRVPVVDLEDREKDYLLKAEMPGFRKENIEIEVQNDSIAISGKVGWKYDKKAQAYICKERACESFYRMVQLPEDIKVDDVRANLSDGVLEITLPKKAPKSKRKIKPE